jgi:hypothetical protein
LSSGAAAEPARQSFIESQHFRLRVEFPWESLIATFGMGLVLFNI